MIPTSSPPVTQPTADLAILALSYAALIVSADMRITSPLLRVIADEFGTDIGTTGLIITLYALPYGLCQLIYGPLGDRFGKLQVISVAVLAFSLCSGICGLATDLPMLCGLRLLTGIAAAAVIPSSLAYLGDQVPYGQRQIAIGRFVGFIAVGQLLSLGVSGGITGWISWRAMFALLGMMGLWVSSRLWRLQGRAPDRKDPTVQLGIKALGPYGKLLGYGRVRWVIGTVFVEGLCFFGSFSYLGAFLRDHYGLEYWLVGLILGGFGMGNILYSRLVKLWVKRLGESGLLRWGGVIMALGRLGITGILSWPLAFPLVIGLGLGYFMMHSTLQTKATELNPAARGMAFSLFALMLFMGQGSGSALFGYLLDHGSNYLQIFWISGLLLGVLGWIHTVVPVLFKLQLLSPPADDPKTP